MDLLTGLVAKCKPTLILVSNSDNLTASPTRTSPQRKTAPGDRLAMTMARWLHRGIVALTAAGSVFLAGNTVARETAPYVTDQTATVSVAELPREAQRTLTLIAQGGPFPYAKDGIVFGNYEKRLPKKPRGYYHEYTVPTPGARNRGARRIICGGDQRTVDPCYYTQDHYNSFRRIRE
ncbi:Guanyl-specific ribonuclease Sa [Pandoraea apista]|nr:Guanyl-specific ribonuclease Sa [Pandoraea apista]